MKIGTCNFAHKHSGSKLGLMILQKKINRATKHTENYARTRNNNYTTYVKGKYNNNNTELALHMKIGTCNFAQKNSDKKLLSIIWQKKINYSANTIEKKPKPRQIIWQSQMQQTLDLITAQKSFRPKTPTRQTNLGRRVKNLKFPKTSILAPEVPYFF